MSKRDTAMHVHGSGCQLHLPHVRRSGEQLEVVEGVNAPAIEKIISDQIPEGMVDTEVDEIGGDGDEEED